MAVPFVFVFFAFVETGLQVMSLSLFPSNSYF